MLAISSGLSAGIELIRLIYIYWKGLLQWFMIYYSGSQSVACPVQQCCPQGWMSQLVFSIHWNPKEVGSDNKEMAQIPFTTATEILTKTRCFLAVIHYFCWLKSFHSLFSGDTWASGGGNKIQVLHWGWALHEAIRKWLVTSTESLQPLRRRPCLQHRNPFSQ